MFRSGASRSILRSLNTSSTAPASRVTSSPVRQQLRSQLCTTALRQQSVTALKPLGPKTLALVRWQSSDGRKPVDKIDTAREERIQHKKLKPDPEHVSATSSVIPPVGTTSVDSEESEPQMMRGILADLVGSCQIRNWQYVMNGSV